MIWLDKAKEYIGTKEIPGNRHNPTILDLWRHAHLNFTSDEVPWCAGFVGGVLEQVNIKSTRSGMARSYLTWGTKTLPKVGAIVVLKRGAPPAGHVGFVVGLTANKVKILGGNQSNEVNEKWFSRTDVLDYRWPPEPKEIKPIQKTVQQVEQKEEKKSMFPFGNMAKAIVGAVVTAGAAWLGTMGFIVPEGVQSWIVDVIAVAIAGLFGGALVYLTPNKKA